MSKDNKDGTEDNYKKKKKTLKMLIINNMPALIAAFTNIRAINEENTVTDEIVHEHRLCLCLHVESVQSRRFR